MIITSMGDSVSSVTWVGEFIICVKLKDLQKSVRALESGLSLFSRLQFRSPRM